MNKVIKYLIILLFLFSISDAIGQNISFPKWLKKGWHTPFESNTNNWVFLTFTNDNIFIVRGIPAEKLKQHSLIDLYKSYKLIQKSKDCLYQLMFSKPNETVIFEFKLLKVDYYDKPTIHYTLTINGKVNEFIVLQ